MEISATTLDSNNTSTLQTLHGDDVTNKSIQDAGFSGHTESQSLSDFLSKPRLIHMLDVTDSFTIDLDPITTLLNEPAVAKRLMYFKRLRGSLHLQFVCNASVYDAGMIIAAIDYNFPNTNLYATSFDKRLISYTQDHVLMDLGSQTVGELVVPLTMKMPFIDISATVPASEFRIRLQAFTDLINMSTAAAATVNVKVYAKILNPEVSGPIHKGPGFVYTSREKDAEVYETADGPISFPASIIANAGKKLKDVPVIGPFAYATGLIASGISRLAILFGFSRPMTLTEIPYPHVEDYSSYAGSMRVKTITLDPMQEIPIGTVNLGTKDDPLSFDKTIGRPGVVALAIWGTSSPATTLITDLPVTPEMAFTGSKSASFLMSPLTYFSQMFMAYRGTIEYEIMVPANRYVNGKLRVTYVPQYVPYSGDYYGISQNAITTVIDLSVSTRMKFSCPYMNTQPYLPTGRPRTVSADGNTKMGHLLIHVESPLINAGNANVQIIITMKAGPDFELQLPIQNQINFFQYAPLTTTQAQPYTEQITTPSYTPFVDNTFNSTPSLASSQWFTYTMKSSAIDPIQDHTVKFNRGFEVDAPSQWQMGERFTSLRPTLKRFYEHYTSVVTSPTQSLSLKLPFVPLANQLPLDGVYGGRYYLKNMLVVPFSHVQKCFYGFTGSTRYMFIAKHNNLERVTVQRDYSTRTYYVYDADSIIPIRTTSPVGSGEATFIKGEPMIVNLPLQGSSQLKTTLIQQPATGAAEYGINAQLNYAMTEEPYEVKIYQSIGEDYQPAGWSGIPMTFIYSIPSSNAP